MLPRVLLLSLQDVGSRAFATTCLLHKIAHVLSAFEKILDQQKVRLIMDIISTEYQGSE